MLGGGKEVFSLKLDLAHKIKYINLNLKSSTYFTRTCAHRGLDYAADASHSVVGRFALLSSTAQLPVVQSTVYSHRR